jgi:8-oxo-dGTP pyrophosphatase MutT (NUDIX family)
MVWKPDVTVAAIIERDGRFLLIEEHVGKRVVINQPAGHLEQNENFLQAAVRETLEETAWDFMPEAISGIYLLPQPDRNMSYLRVAFVGSLVRHHSNRRLDHGIRRTLWLSRDEAMQRSDQLRSPLVLHCMDDYLRGQRFPLDLITHFDAATSLPITKLA